MRRFCVIFGTRPEAIKLAPVIYRLKKLRGSDVKIIVTGQHRKMLDQALGALDIRPHFDLNIMRHDQDLESITASAIKKLARVLRDIKPSVVIVQGDTTTTFVSSLAAFYQKIPIAYVESGLRTYDKYGPFPEEVNRRLVSALADFHFVPTQNAKQNLLKENISFRKIWVTGNTVIDILLMILKKKTEFRSPFLRKFDFSKKKILLVTLHRRESFGPKLIGALQALRDIARKEDVTLIFPVHMNPYVSHQARKILSGRSNIHLIEPLAYDDFVKLMSKSTLIITDSGGIQEEICTLKKPALVIREKTERKEAIEAGFARLMGYKKLAIIREAQRLLHDPKYYASRCGHENPFGDGTASKKIAAVLNKYIAR